MFGMHQNKLQKGLSVDCCSVTRLRQCTPGHQSCRFFSSNLVEIFVAIMHLFLNFFLCTHSILEIECNIGNRMLTNLWGFAFT